MAVAMLAAYEWRRRGAAGVSSESMGPRSISWSTGRFGVSGAITFPSEIQELLAPYMLVEV